MQCSTVPPNNNPPLARYKEGQRWWGQYCRRFHGRRAPGPGRGGHWTGQPPAGVAASPAIRRVVRTLDTGVFLLTAPKLSVNKPQVAQTLHNGAQSSQKTNNTLLTAVSCLRLSFGDSTFRINLKHFQQCCFILNSVVKPDPFIFWSDINQHSNSERFLELCFQDIETTQQATQNSENQDRTQYHVSSSENTCNFVSFRPFPFQLLVPVFSYSAQCSAVQCYAVQCSAVQCSAMEGGSLHCRPVALFACYFP